MRAVIQRVTSASVAVNNEVISEISRGLMVLVGIGTGLCSALVCGIQSKLVETQHGVKTDDDAADVEVLSKKILSLRVFSDSTDTMWKAGVKDIDGEILCVSQFTLMGTTKGNGKPDFHNAMATEPSSKLYARFLEELGNSYRPDKIKDGKFGAMMNVSLTNDGPVTFTIDSRKYQYVDQTVSGTEKYKGKKSTQTEKSFDPPATSSSA